MEVPFPLNSDWNQKMKEVGGRHREIEIDRERRRDREKGDVGKLQ